MEYFITAFIFIIIMSLLSIWDSFSNHNQIRRNSGLPKHTYKQYRKCQNHRTFDTHF